MLARKIVIVPPPDRRMRIKWSDRHNLALMEDDVELIRQNELEAVVSGAVRILENTQVYLLSACSMRNGIVSSCYPEGSRFVLTLAIAPESSLVSPRHEFDPGLLQVDSFLTQEEEAKILDSFIGDVPCSLLLQRGILDYLSEIGRTTGHFFAEVQRKAMSLLLPAACF